MGIKLFLIHRFLQHNRKKARKKTRWIGTRFMIQRSNAPDVETILYKPENRKYTPMPVMFNIHGGAWVGGDASVLDTQSQQLADTLSCFVVNINYRKVDEKPFPFCQNEVKNTVLYFAEHAEEYGLDKTRFSLIGYSAGGHICAGAAMLLRDTGFMLNSHVMCYPFLDFHTFDAGVIPGMEKDTRNDKTMKIMKEVFFRGEIDPYCELMSPAAAETEKLEGLSPAEFIICGTDALYQQALDYHKKLVEAGVCAEIKIFEASVHGFMEGNYPEIPDETDEKQRVLRDECFDYLKKRMKICWNY